MVGIDPVRRQPDREVQGGQPRFVVQALGLIEQPSLRPDQVDGEPGPHGPASRRVGRRIGEHVRAARTASRMHELMSPGPSQAGTRS